METHNEVTMKVIESHKKAAEAHQEAAKAHLEAMKFHTGGDEIQANESAKSAYTHSQQAAIYDKEVAHHHGL